MRTRVGALCAVYLAFAMPVAMLGVAWPELRELLSRGDGELGVLAGCYGLGRLSMGTSSAVLLRRLPFGPALCAAALVLAIASLGVAAAPAWPALVVVITVVGLASGVLESLGSRFLAVAASVRTAGVVAGSYSIGATIGPALVAWSGRWQLSYAVAAAVIAGTGLVFIAPALRDVGATAPGEAGGDGAPAGSGRRDLLGIALSLSLFTVFVGIEVTAGQWTATLLEQARGLDRQAAGFAVSGFFAGITVGRLFLGAVALHMRSVLVAAVAVVPALVLMAAGPPRLAPVAVTVAGLAVAPMFPALMATTGSRVGAARAGQVSGWQLLAGNIGATSLPALTGLLVALTGPAAPSLVLVVLAVAGVALLALSMARARTPAAVGT